MCMLAFVFGGNVRPDDEEGGRHAAAVRREATPTISDRPVATPTMRRNLENNRTMTWTRTRITRFLPLVAAALAVASCSIAPPPDAPSVDDSPTTPVPDCTQSIECGASEACRGGECVAVDGPPCAVEPDCVLGEECANGVCAAIDADIEYWAEVNDELAPVVDGGEIPVYRGLQGGLHTLVTVRATGYAALKATLTLGIALEEDDFEVAAPRPIPITLVPFEDSVMEAREVLVVFDIKSLSFLEGKSAVITLTLADDANLSSLVQRVVLVGVE